MHAMGLFTLLAQSPRLLGLLLVSLSLCASPVVADEQADMLKVQREIEQLQQELKKVQGTRSNLQQALQKSESAIDKLQSKARNIEQELKQQQQEIKQLNNQRSSLEQQHLQQQQFMAKEVVAAYKNGPQNQLKILLNQESPDSITRMMEYQRYFMQAHQLKMDEFIATIAQIDGLIPTIEQKSHRLTQLQDQLGSEQKNLQAAHQTRQAALAKVNQAVKSASSELAQLQDDKRRLQALLDKVTHSIAHSGALTAPAYVALPGKGEKFSLRKGRLPWPTQGQMLHRFGSSRIAGQINWNGVVIAASMGSSVIAVHHGRIVFADYFGSHGLLLIIDHGEGFMSLYAHNQHLLKKAGELVVAGDKIATVGNSGGQTSSAVYFEIRRQGQPIDPNPWFARS
jgi:septal ring factor EnvC (AmiA/AmiB activator)